MCVISPPPVHSQFNPLQRSMQKLLAHNKMVASPKIFELVICGTLEIEGGGGGKEIPSNLLKFFFLAWRRFFYSNAPGKHTYKPAQQSVHVMPKTFLIHSLTHPVLP